MLFFAAIAALAVAANAQHLRFSPAVIGSTTPGAEHHIVLSPVGTVHTQPKVVAITKHEIAPKHFVAAQTYTAKPVAHKLVHVPHTVAEPIIKVHSVHPTVVEHQPTIQYTAAPVVHQPVVHQAVPVKYTAAPVVHQPVVHQAVPVKYTAAPLVHEEKFEIQPYAFGFDSVDEHGAKHERQETKDANGVVTGSYTIQDSTTGAHRIVNYVADSEGFRASIQSNEPGMISSSPAGVQIQATGHVPA